MKSRRAELALTVLGASLLSFVMLELGLRAYFRHVQSLDIEMWKYARMLKQNVPDARSHIHRPNVSARVMGVEVRINSKGLRDVERPYRKGPGVYRILVLGDSFTFGFGVGQEETFSKRLEGLLNADPAREKTYEVINTGVGNYNTLQELATLQMEGRKYEPDHILLAFFTNDAEPTQKEDTSFLARNCLSCITLRAFQKAVTARFYPQQQYREYYNGLYQGRNWDEYAKTLEGVVSEAKGLHARLTVLILPDLHSLKDYPFREIHQRLARFFRDRGCGVIDALDALPPVPDASRYWVAWDDPHPNAQAHRLIADYIRKRIKL